jgi:hypothetical protein
MTTFHDRSKSSSPKGNQLTLPDSPSTPLLQSRPPSSSTTSQRPFNASRNPAIRSRWTPWWYRSSGTRFCGYQKLSKMGSDEGCVRKLRGQNHACTDRAGDNDAAETPIPRQHIAKQRGRGSVHELELVKAGSPSAVDQCFTAVQHHLAVLGKPVQHRFHLLQDVVLGDHISSNLNPSQLEDILHRRVLYPLIYPYVKVIKGIA